jgi:hypothetical protein
MAAVFCRRQHGLGLDPSLELFVQSLDRIRGAYAAPLARRQAGEGEQAFSRLMTNDDLKELTGIHENLIQEQAVIKMHALNVKELAEKLEAIISKEAERVGFDPFEVTEF